MHYVVESRHVTIRLRGNPTGCSSAVFAGLNIRSLLNKFDDVKLLMNSFAIVASICCA